MKSLPIFAIVIVGLVSACTFRHETVERRRSGRDRGRHAGSGVEHRGLHRSGASHRHHNRLHPLGSKP